MNKILKPIRRKEYILHHRRYAYNPLSEKIRICKYPLSFKTEEKAILQLTKYNEWIKKQIRYIEKSNYYTENDGLYGFIEEACDEENEYLNNEECETKIYIWDVQGVEIINKTITTKLIHIDIEEPIEF